MDERVYKVRTPLFPLYSTVRQLLNIFDGLQKQTVTSMINAIMDQTGTPQNPVDWSDPDTWIGERLKGDFAALATRIWQESNHTVSPRYTYGAYLFINSYELLVPDSMGIYWLTERGKAFLNEEERIIRELDDIEGIFQILSILSTKTRAKRADILPEWSDFLKEYSKFGTASTIKDTLRRRLASMVERDLVIREGNYYDISEKGMEYLSSHTPLPDDPKKTLMRSVKSYNDEQIEALREKLGSMSPVAFEHLIRELLESMGYEDVLVTKQSGDKGVDVVATVQFGITTITEVVQVKRHQSSIGRPVLDQLRGALPYHKAIRGTLITLGTFSKGCQEAALFPGAAPIGLIDGKKLIELLMEHEVGVKKSPVTLYKVDEEFFEVSDEREQVEEALMKETE